MNTQTEPTRAASEPESPSDWQEAIVSKKTSSIIAARFYNSAMELIESHQLINSGRAFAIADFRNGELERFDCSPARIEESKAWLAGLMAESKA